MNIYGSMRYTNQLKNNVNTKIKRLEKDYFCSRHLGKKPKKVQIARVILP